MTDYQQATTAGLTTDTFPTWAASNAATYNNAVQAYQAAAGQAEQASQAMNGALAPQYSRDTGVIDSALYSQAPINGSVSFVIRSGL